MVARARKPKESFKKYRANLIKEERDLKERLTGKFHFTAVRYFHEWVEKLAKKVWHKKTQTYVNPRRKNR